MQHMKRTSPRAGTGTGRAGGFSLVELLTVIGVISILIALLLPSLSRARAQAEAVQCMSNLRQVGMALQIYSNDNDGWLYPPNLGANRPPQQRWPVHVFKDGAGNPIWNPPILLCPSDIEPNQDHSYILNYHLVEKGIKAGSRIAGAAGASEVILMGEKRSDWPDYYMNGDSGGGGGGGDYWTRVEPYRHGIRLGSNYLYMDGHVVTTPPREASVGIDPWDISSTPPPPLPTTP